MMSAENVRMMRWLIALLLLTFWLGAHNLNTNPVWGDERNSIRDAGGAFFESKSMIEVWQDLIEVNPWHTPGYFILLSGWGHLSGWTLPALRLLSLLAGMLTVAWTYRLGADRISRQVGLYGAAILATSMMFLHHLITVRMYSLMALFTVVLLWFYFRLVDEPPRWWDWLGLFVGALGLLYTHYFAGLAVGVIGLYHLFLLARRCLPFKHWLRIAAVLGVAGLLFLPWLGGLVVGLQANSQEGDNLYRRAMSAGEAIERLLLIFGNGYIQLFAAGLILALAGIFLYRGQQRRRYIQLVSVAVGIILAALIANEILKVMEPGRLRYVIGAFPLLALIVGAGLTQLHIILGEHLGRWIGGLLLAMWLLTGIYSYATRRPSREFDQFDYIFPVHSVARDLEGEVLPGDIIVTYIPDDDPLQNHHYRGIASFYFGSELNYALRRSSMLDAPETQVQFESASQRLRVWVAHNPKPLPEHFEEFTAALDVDFDYCRTVIDEAALKIDLYTRLPGCCLADGQFAPLVTYERGFNLAGLEFAPDADESILPVVTTWDMTDDAAFYNHSMALHVTDSNGELVAQADEGMQLPDLTCRQTNIPLDDLPPGEYTLNLILYNWETGTRLLGTMPASETSGEILAVKQFMVE